MKNIFLIPLLLILFFSCKKDDKTCNTTPDTDVNFLSSSSTFYYNSANNLLLQSALSKSSLDSIILQINNSSISNIYANNNITSFALLFNSNDTSVLSSFDETDLNGIIFYGFDSTVNKLYSLVYKIESGVFIKDEYLSTFARYQTFNDVRKLSYLYSSGVDNNVKVIFSTNINQDSDYYAEFTQRVNYSMRKGGYLLAGYDNCGFECGINIPQTSCVFGGFTYSCQPTGNLSVDLCAQNRGLEVATPISYTTTQINNAADLQYYLRDSVLLHSKKGISYTTMYYYIGSKLDAGFLTSNFLNIYDVVMQNAIPLIQRITDPTYSGSLYNNTDLTAFIFVIDLLKHEFTGDADVTNFLINLETDLTTHVNENKNTVLSTFAAAE